MVCQQHWPVNKTGNFFSRLHQVIVNNKAVKMFGSKSSKIIQRKTNLFFYVPLYTELTGDFNFRVWL